MLLASELRLCRTVRKALSSTRKLIEAMPPIHEAEPQRIRERVGKAGPYRTVRGQAAVVAWPLHHSHEFGEP
jgi:hypothetical protein